MSSSKKSPYKKVAEKNHDYAQYVNMEELVPNKAHKIYNFMATHNEKCGAGQMAYLYTSGKRRLKTQLPKKYLNQLDIPDDINMMVEDIRKRDNPYLIYRERLPDKSFRIDILPPDDAMKNAFSNNLDVPEMNESNSSEDHSPSKKAKESV